NHRFHRTVRFQSTMMKKLLIYQQLFFENANINCDKTKRNSFFHKIRKKGQGNKSLADIKEDECHDNTT
ncbi:MAG: hypothetical protein K2H91_02200, partial [Lachnospiraceae bacterium]|nr:hypothetical protein [Lachnospiraceae bacterium]